VPLADTQKNVLAWNYLVVAVYRLVPAISELRLLLARDFEGFSLGFCSKWVLATFLPRLEMW